MNPIPLDAMPAMGRYTVGLTSSLSLFRRERKVSPVFSSNHLPFERGLETRDDLIPGPKLFTRNEPRITAHRPPQVSSVPSIPDLIGFVTFFNGFLFLRLRVGSARTDRRWNL